MFKIVSRHHRLLNYHNVIRPSYYCEAPENPNISAEIKKISKSGLRPKGNMGELWEPGVGPVDLQGLPSRKQIRRITKEIKEEFGLWVQEVKESLKADPPMHAEHGIIHKIWTFEKEGSLKGFAYTNDSEQEFGYSTCTLTRTSNGTLLFKGNLSTDIRDDGVTVRSGFCGFRTPRAEKSFRRKSYYDWGMFTHVVLKVRGDGRYYIINLGQDDFFDNSWYDMQSYFLFTRGGPYWQTIKIPFSKFLMTHKGKIQDRQPDLEPTMITFLGITMMDDISGPFQLEVDYIGVMYDANHTEESAYEQYDTTVPAFT